MRKPTLLLKIILVMLLFTILLFVDFKTLKKKIKFSIKQCILFFYDFQNRKKGS